MILRIKLYAANATFNSLRTIFGVLARSTLISTIVLTSLKLFYVPLYGYYQLSGLFTNGKGPEMYPISVGFLLMPF